MKLYFREFVQGQQTSLMNVDKETIEKVLKQLEEETNLLFSKEYLEHKNKLEYVKHNHIHMRRFKEILIEDYKYSCEVVQDDTTSYIMCNMKVED